MPVYWICFGDSAKGTLRCARGEMEDAPAFDQILALSDDLSIGDISNLTDREARKYTVCPWLDDPESSREDDEAYIDRYFQADLPALDQVDEAVIWYGDNAAEQCGMLRAAHELYRRGVPFSLVHVDQLTKKEIPAPKKARRRGAHVIGGASVVGVITDSERLNKILRHVPQFILRYSFERGRKRRYKNRSELVKYRGAGEMEPEIAPVFYRKRHRVSACEAKLLSGRWETLVRENAPLRVLENGRPVSAPAEYYDELILSHVPEEETVAALVIGRALNDCIVGDGLIFNRIRALAAAGKIEILRDGGNYRETTIRLRK